jgi:hypothetical protein
MAQLRASSQTADNAAQAAQPYRYVPRSLSIHSRRRFNTRRKREYLSQIVGRPSRWQIAAVESLLRREWISLVAERADDPDTALRADREYQKLLADFRRSLPPPTAAPQPPSFEQVLSDIVARRRPDPEDDDRSEDAA